MPWVASVEIFQTRVPLALFTKVCQSPGMPVYGPWLAPGHAESVLAEGWGGEAKGSQASRRLGPEAPALICLIESEPPKFNQMARTKARLFDQWLIFSRMPLPDGHRPGGTG